MEKSSQDLPKRWREREADSEAERRQTLSSPGREGGRHPVFGKSSPFAGRRWNGGLGRSSVSFGRSPPPSGRCADDSGCPVTAEQGNVVSVRNASHTHSPQRPSCQSGSEDTSLFSVHGPVPHHSNRKERESGLVGIAVGQLRAIGRNRHRGQSGRMQRGSPLVIALARGSA